MRERLFACGLLAMAAGCMPAEEATLGSAGVASARPAAPTAREAAKLISRSVWGVVPTTPRYKKDLKPELIRGSAVAVTEDTLLAACAVVGERERVGVVRHNKYYVAEVRREQGAADSCELRVEGVRLNPVAGSRRLSEVGEGEAVFALVNRDSARFALAEGRLTGGPGGGSRLATDLEVAPGSNSVVLFDRQGNLLGLAVPGSVRRTMPGGSVAAVAP